MLINMCSCAPGGGGGVSFSYTQGKVMALYLSEIQPEEQVILGHTNHQQYKSRITLQGFQLVCVVVHQSRLKLQFHLWSERYIIQF